MHVTHSLAAFFACNMHEAVLPWQPCKQSAASLSCPSDIGFQRTSLAAHILEAVYGDNVLPEKPPPRMCMQYSKGRSAPKGKHAAADPPRVYDAPSCALSKALTIFFLHSHWFVPMAAMS